MNTATAAAPKDLAPNITPAKQNNEVEYNANVPVDLIVPDPKNRDKIDPKRVDELAENIADIGLLQPVVVRVLKDGKYMLIAGEHRWRAYKELKLETIAARIYRNQTELEAAKRKAAENAIRVDLTPIEKAKRYQELQQLGASQKEIGSSCGGVSQPVVANALRLLTLPADVQKLLADGIITEAHGVSLARFTKWPKVCSKIASLVAKCIDDEYEPATSKWLNGESLPYSSELEDAKLIIEIHTNSYQESNYVLPAELKKDPDFFVDNHSAYYILPAPGQPNKWEPERKKQDLARESKKKDQAKEAKIQKAKDGKLTKEQLERKKKLDGNKKSRTTITVTLAGAVNQLVEAKKVPSTAVQVVFENAVKSGHIDEAAKLFGIKIKTEDELEEHDYYNYGYRELHYEQLYSLGDDVLLKLAACTVMLSEAADATRFASEVPGCVSHIASGKLLVSVPVIDELKAEKPEWIAEVGKRLDQGYTPGEIAKEYADKKSALAAIKAIKKNLVAIGEQQAVIEAAKAKPVKKKGKK